MSDSINAEFEAYVKAELGDIAVVSEGRFISPKIQNYFKIWQHLQAEVEALRKDATWQPIDTAPKDHFPRLYMVKGRCVQGFIDVTGMHCAQTDYQPWRKMYCTPTHWMPLPKPPTAIAKDTQKQ
jgi:hypothetical protein